MYNDRIDEMRVRCSARPQRRRIDAIVGLDVLARTRFSIDYRKR